MRWTLGSDIAEYAEKHGKMIIPLAVLADICLGMLAQSDGIRIDTEELINNPGTTVGWLYIGRFGLALLKGALGLGTHHALRSGLLFLLFFILGVNLLTYGLYHFSGKNDRYPYWVFMLLYVTSNIWCYQIYFSLQQAEIAFAMLLVVGAAILSMDACFLKKGKWNIFRFAVAVVWIVIGLGAYQALAVYYIAICMMFFLVLLSQTGGAKTDRGILTGIAKLIVQFGISYVIYDVIAKTWFMAASDYMENQMGWGRLSSTECIKNVLRTAKNILLGHGPRNFSFYTVGVLLAILTVIFAWRARQMGRLSWSGIRFWLFVLGMAGVVVSPLLMTIYMGEMLVTRSQFALPVAAAFLGMYGLGTMRGAWETPKSPEDTGTQEVEVTEQTVDAEGKEQVRRIAAAVVSVLVVLTAVLQSGYDLRLYYTDEVRMGEDVEKTNTLLDTLYKANGGELPKQPVVFVGYQKPKLNRLCGRTEMYGWSFYEWDYSSANPTGATHRICGFVQAYTGQVLNENASGEQRQEAVRLAADMPDFPAEGSVVITEDSVVVRLSAVTERADNNWW